MGGYKATCWGSYEGGKKFEPNSWAEPRFFSQAFARFGSNQKKLNLKKFEPSSSSACELTRLD